MAALLNQILSGAPGRRSTELEHRFTRDETGKMCLKKNMIGTQCGERKLVLSPSDHPFIYLIIYLFFVYKLKRNWCLKNTRLWLLKCCVLDSDAVYSGTNVLKFVRYSLMMSQPWRRNILKGQLFKILKTVT
jgi:hypothetical protein